MFDEEFIDEAKKVLEAADKRGIELRVMGAVALRMHCHESVDIHEKMGRFLTDLDFMTLKKQSKEVTGLFEELGYTTDRRSFYTIPISGRCIFQKKAGSEFIVADVFFDELKMCHTVDFRERLDIDYPTISLADFFLEKAQIVKMNEKDMKDLLVLFREHDVGDADKETINGEYISGLLSKDWGLYYTVTTNIKKTMSFLEKCETLTDEDRAIIRSRMDKLLQAIEQKPKSIRWKLRARQGTSRKWYRDVESITGDYADKEGYWR